MDRDSQQQSLVDRIKQAQNVLVTVSTNPNVDQLSAAIGLTLALNKLDKHATAVFSGQVPSTIDFLKPEETLERNTDSLRDFIIALDKSKADKLRYKVEDDVVRIFITPYRTSLSEKDLQFSQGDFNVDVVVALGVTDQKDLDAAITAHGRILHDATVTSVNLVGGGEVGTINWVDDKASSLSELMLDLIDGLDTSLLDGQIATALLTGIVASTDRFRNEKTTPATMQVSAELMAAGANQQLIASELEVPAVSVRKAGKQGDKTGKPSEPGTLAIDHPGDKGERFPDEPAHPHNDQPPERRGPSDLPPPGLSREEMAPTPEELRAPAPEDDLFGLASQLPVPARPQINVDENGMLLPPLQPVVPLPQISQVHVVDEEDGPHVEQHHQSVMGGPGQSMVGDDDFDQLANPMALPPMPAATLSHGQSVLPGSSKPLSIVAPPTEPGGSLTTGPLAVVSPTGPAPAVSASGPGLLAPLPPTLPPLAAPILTPPAAPVLSPAPTPAMAPLPTLPQTPPPMSPPPISPASASFRADETLIEIEEAVHSPHIAQEKATMAAEQGAVPASTATVDDARDAVTAAFNSASSAATAVPRPIAALNAQPLGLPLHGAALPPLPPLPTAPAPSGPLPPPIVPLGGEQAPGNTPDAAAMDMPLPSNPFGPGQQSGALPPPIAPLGSQASSPGAAPPVPPPFVPPMPQ